MSRENPSRSERRDQRQAELVDNVAEAMRQLGWLAPGDDQEVRGAETELAGTPVQLPEGLRDEDAVLSADDVGKRSDVYRFEADPGTEATLARAAREGGEIPAHIERRMREDRLAAQQENEDGTQEPTETP